MNPAPQTELPSSAGGKSVFFLGATGFVGGSVLTQLLSLPTPPSLITCLIRDPKKIEHLGTFSTPSGTTLGPLQGSLADVDKIERAAETHDIVISCADCDDMPSIKAFLEGMKKRKAKTGHRSVLVHTTGTGLFVDESKGQWPTDKIYTDLNPTPATGSRPALLSITDLSDDAPHRKEDLAIIGADAAGHCKAYLIAPSTIWGEGKGELFDKGFAKSWSQQMPNIARASLDRGRAGMFGKGANIWGHVSIDDLKELYSLVYAGALRGDIGHGASGYYIGISGEYTWLAAAQTIGAVMLEKGWTDDAQPVGYTEEEVQKYARVSWMGGGNSRGVADRSKSIGWRPKFSELEDFVQHVRSETIRMEKMFGRKWNK